MEMGRKARKKPDKWDTIPNCRRKILGAGITKYEIIDPVLRYIEDFVGKKELLRHHHINNLGGELIVNLRDGGRAIL